MTDSFTRKEGLRKKARTRLNGLPAEIQAEASRAITEKLLSSPLFSACKTLFVYVSIPGEPDTARLIRSAIKSGKTVCVPRCGKDGKMDAVPIGDLSQLTGAGPFGIPQPNGNIAPIDPKKIDLVIVPCVAAGTSGERLGHGAGYYDRFLAACPGTSVCLCFDALLTDGIPMERHDVFMENVITEKNWYAKEADE
ncbi:MAG: 5-formyltetrahydrofolate cyclo-ligase [Clostridia bacterium]|nr:5-formyltetrahydrofolate cyclo-ligase [Clostridia bacterium]